MTNVLINILEPDDWQDRNNWSQSSRAERDLLLRLKEGDNVAWTRLTEQYGTRLYRYLASHLPDAATVEDVMGETLAAVVREIRELPDNGSLSTFIFAVADRTLNRTLNSYLPKMHRQDIDSAADLEEMAQENINFGETLARLSPLERQVLLLRRADKATENRPPKVHPPLQERLLEQAQLALASQTIPHKIPQFTSALQMLDEQIERCIALGMRFEAELFTRYASQLNQIVNKTTLG